MTTLRTELQIASRELKRYQPTDLDYLQVAFVKAMEHHRSTPLWFNESTWNMTLQAGTERYPHTKDPQTSDPPSQIFTFPWDIWSPKKMQIQVGSTWYDPMDMVDIGEIRELIYNDSNTGYPNKYAQWGEAYFLEPIPQSAFPLRFDYIRAIDTPRYNFDGSNWVFEQRDPVSGNWETLDPTYRNDWLDVVPQLTSAWAKWKMYHAYYKDRKAAEDAWAEYQLELQRVESETDRRKQGDVSLSPTEY